MKETAFTRCSSLEDAEKKLKEAFGYVLMHESQETIAKAAQAMADHIDWRIVTIVEKAVDAVERGDITIEEAFKQVKADLRRDSSTVEQ